MAARKTARQAAKKTAKKAAKKPAKKAAKKSAKGAKPAGKNTAARPAARKKSPARKATKAAAAPMIGYTTSNVFAGFTIQQVWEAAVESQHLKQHFVDDMRGEFGEDLAPVGWFWKAWDWMTITPKVFKKHEQIVWDAIGMDGKTKITITFDFLEKDGRTIFRISEAGYAAGDLKSAFMMCEGWTEFHCGVKAYLMGGVLINR